MSGDGQADRATLETLNRLNTAVVGDVLDKMGYHYQFLPPDIKPLQPDSKLAGRAMTVLQEDLAIPTNTPEDKPFGLLFEALDDLNPDEIYVAAGSSLRFPYALFGGLMATRAKHLGAGGAILDGFVRDAHDIELLGFTVFSRGLYAQDQGARGKVTKYRCKIQIGNVTVQPGDLVFGDREGVLIIPREIANEAIQRAVEKASTENRVEEAIRSGMSASNAYSQFGVF